MKTAEQLARRRAVRARCYAKHREKNLEYAAKYRAENADRIKALFAEKNAEYVRRYRERHPEKSREHGLAWKAANRERHRAYCAEWTRLNPEKNRLKEHRRRARKAAVGGTLSEGIAEKLMKLQRGRCACCGERLGDDYHIDHILPLALGGPNTDSNVQLLRKGCNLSKGAKHPVEFMQKRGKLL